MSYEGVNHKLCRVGHYDSFDAVTEMYEETTEKCECGEPFVYVFYQDQTNGEYEEDPRTVSPDMGRFEIEPAKYETCNLGHEHLISEARYRVPENCFWQKIQR